MRHPRPPAQRSPRPAVLLAGTAGVVLLAGLLSGCGHAKQRAGAPAPSTSAAVVAEAPTRAPGLPVNALPTGTPVPGGAAPSTGPAGRPGTATPTGATGGRTTATVPPATAAPAAACTGSPSADQVVALLRQTSGVVPTGQAVQVVTGPLCAGDWQYTVVSMEGRDALQVVSRRSGTGLTLVSAGTDVCTDEVQAAAPTGILAAAGCTPA